MSPSAREVDAVTAMEVCAGIGGLTLALEMAGFETAALAELDPRCRAHLREKWPSVPVFSDFTAIADDDLRRVGRIDLLAGGIPCQPWSVAGKRAGSDDERDLWPAFLGLAQRLGAAAVLVENVPGLASDPQGLDRIAGDLERAGYAWWACSVRAADVGAPHLRDRLFLCAVARPEGVGPSTGARKPGGRSEPGQPQRSGLAGPMANHHSQGRRQLRQGGELAEQSPGHDANGRCGPDILALAAKPGRQGRRRAGGSDAQLAAAERGSQMGNADGSRSQGAEPAGSTAAMRRRLADAGHSSPWAGAVPILCRDGKSRLIPPEPELFPVAHGVPGRVARLRAVGNAVVPLQAYVPARALFEELTARSLAA